MKSFIAKRVNSILVNLRYLRFKLLKYRENNKKICNTFDHNFKNIPLYIMRKVSLERYYFVLYDGALTWKISKWRLPRFAIKLFMYYTILFQLKNNHPVLKPVIFFYMPKLKGENMNNSKLHDFCIIPILCFCFAQDFKIHIRFSWEEMQSKDMR